MQRAINCEKPDDTWSVYSCVVVSTGHLSYAAGFKVVRDKCSQKYNTSSADEQINASKFRRMHPVLALKQQGTRSFEQVFFKPNAMIIKADVHQSENVETVNASDEILTEQLEDDFNVVNVKEIRQQNELQYASSEHRISRPRSNSPDRSIETEPLGKMEANTSRNRRERRISRPRSISRNRSTVMEPVDRTETNNSRNKERRISLPRSRSRDRSIAMKPVGRTEINSSRNSRERCVSRPRSNSRDRSTAKKPVIRTESSSSRNSSERRDNSSRSNPRSSSSDSSRSRSPFRRSSHSFRSRSRSRIRDSRSHSSFRGSASVDTSRSGMNYLIKLVETFSQRQVEHERRLNRIEVSINKTLILVGDLSNSNNLLTNPAGLMDEESDMEINEFEVPKLPIQNLNELFTIQKQLKNRRFKRFLIKHERDFCTPSKISTQTVTLTKYLKRFISLDTRCKITLKEKTRTGYTLMDDFHRVYTFLIELMRAGYQNCNKTLTVDEAHTALRTVWGRSKQKKNEDQQKKINQKRLDDKKKKSHGSRRNYR